MNDLYQSNNDCGGERLRKKEARKETKKYEMRRRRGVQVLAHPNTCNRTVWR